LYFEKLQADFDSRVVKQSQTKHAKKSFGVDLTAFKANASNALNNVFAKPAFVAFA
jgi:hypothetical protein